MIHLVLGEVGQMSGGIGGIRLVPEDWILNIDEHLKSLL